MAYKLLALDLDDTLLDADKRILSKDKDAIARAQAAGIQVILSSGRGYEGIEPFNKELNINNYTIACGGAQIIDKKGNMIYSNYVPPIAAGQVMRWAALRDIHFQVYLDDGFHYLKRTEYSDFYERVCNYKGIENPGLLALETVLTSKILFIDSDEKIKIYRKEILSLFPELCVQTSQSYYLEIMNPDTSKGNALSYVSDKLGVEQHQVVAVGDSEIDMSMLTYAGLGVAVANAVPKVLDIADYVTCSNEEGGVARVIDKFMLI